MHTQKRSQLEIYFDARKGTYWLQLPERFLNLDGRNVKLHMRRNEIAIDGEDEYGLKLGDKILTNAQLEKCCDYAGPLAGHKKGVLVIGGKRILITSEAKQITAKKGAWRRLAKFLGELLGVDQVEHFLYWLKCARASLLSGDFRPGQMVVLAGPSGCGKSLLQAIITEMLGGRMAKPYRYMTGATAFNSDLAGAEHLVIADETARPDIRSRRELGAKIKDMCVNLEISVHAKGCEAITLYTFHRLSLSCNDEAENLMILPPLDDSILDKIMLFRCDVASVGPDRKDIWSGFTGELPAFAYALENMKIPAEYQCNRYGVKAYHNPELLDLVTGLSPETRLLALIDQVLFPEVGGKKDKFNDGPWEGGSMELEQQLRKSEFAFAVESLLHYASACGVYLQRLAQKFPDRFEKKLRRGKAVWIIGKEKNDK